MQSKAVSTALRLSPTAITTMEAALEEQFGITIARKDNNGPSLRQFTIRDLYALSRLRKDMRGWRRPERPVTIAVYAQKGGVAKTTVAANLISMLQYDGFSVLGVDADHQANLTSMFGLDPELTTDDAPSSAEAVEFHFGNLFQIPPFYDRSQGTSVPLERVIKKPLSEFGPALVPADTSLSILESAINIASNRDHLVSLMLHAARLPENTPEEIERKRRLTPHDMREYDFVVFDCPPQAPNNLLIRPILLATDLLIVPVRMDELSIKGLSLMYAALDQLEQDFGKRPEVMLVPTFHNERLRRVQLAQIKLIERYASDLSGVKIPQTEELPASLADGVPLVVSHPTSKLVTNEFRTLANEVFERAQRIAHQG